MLLVELCKWQKGGFRDIMPSLAVCLYVHGVQLMSKIFTRRGIGKGEGCYQGKNF